MAACLTISGSGSHLFREFLVNLRKRVKDGPRDENEQIDQSQESDQREQLVVTQ